MAEGVNTIWQSKEDGKKRDAKRDVSGLARCDTLLLHHFSRTSPVLQCHRKWGRDAQMCRSAGFTADSPAFALIASSLGGFLTVPGHSFRLDN